MTELYTLYNDNLMLSEAKDKKERAQAITEQNAAEEIRAASMMGMVDRTRLTDITKNASSSIREQQGQREKYVHGRKDQSIKLT